MNCFTIQFCILFKSKYKQEKNEMYCRNRNRDRTANKKKRVSKEILKSSP